jgi:hypothetical protein
LQRRFAGAGNWVGEQAALLPSGNRSKSCRATPMRRDPALEKWQRSMLQLPAAACRRGRHLAVRVTCRNVASHRDVIEAGRKRVADPLLLY